MMIERLLRFIMWGATASPRLWGWIVAIAVLI
jgi:hypothetical protein